MSVSFVESTATVHCDHRDHTFAVDLKVNYDGLHGAFAVPSEALPRPPAHLSHEEFPDAAPHRSCPEKLILAWTKKE